MIYLNFLTATKIAFMEVTKVLISYVMMHGMNDTKALHKLSQLPIFLSSR